MNRYIFIFSITLLCFSCYKELDLKLPDSEAKLVLNSYFNPDSIWQVSVTSSNGLERSSNENYIDHAIVELYENGIFLEQLMYTELGRYRSLQEHKPLEGKVYTVKVQADGFPPVEAADRIPSKARYSYEFYDTSDLYTFGLNITLHDPLTDNFYGIFATSTDTTIYEMENGNDTTVFNKFSQIDVSEGINTGPMTLINDQKFDGRDYLISIEAKRPDKPVIYIGTVSNSFYQYHKTYQEHFNYQEIPMVEPSEVYSNVKGGLGIFAGYNFSE